MSEMSVLHMELGRDSYDVVVERGALKRAGALLNLNRRVLLLTDSGVPARHVQTVKSQCKEAQAVCLAPGEANKCPEKYLEILKVMAEARFDRGDCVVAVGGGVIGDLAGFVAATYMRGVDFYNLPTTLLSQIDSSVGGKVAIDFEGYKNLVGAFYQPKKVLIDPDTLETLDRRQFACGMAEAIKMFATSDKEAFERLEDRSVGMPVEEVIGRALKVKMQVVQEDEKEKGLRKVLNFGHTVGHAVESISSKEPYPLLHGECVGIGMLALTEGSVRDRIARLLHRYDLPTACRCGKQALSAALVHDKKAESERIAVVLVPEIGRFVFEKMSVAEITEKSGEVLAYQ